MDKKRVDSILDELWACHLPSCEDAKYVLEVGQKLLIEEPNVLELHSPMTVCGDIHGQLYDLLELFSVGGHPPEQNFLFLGDYVDRGFYSAETFLLLLALKIRYPTKIYLLRGNHESRQTTEDYGFKDEALRKFGEDGLVYDMYMKVFDALPLAALIDDVIFCVHGGLSDQLETIQQIRDIDRNMEIPDTGLFSDILWSDPDDSVEMYEESQRGAGFIFGAKACNEFLEKNNLKFMCRAHQVAKDGFVDWFGGKCYTVWSAPNYCYRGGNKATVFEIAGPEQTKFKVFREAPACARGKIPDSLLPQYFV